MSVRTPVAMLVAGLLLTACEGILGGIYDEADSAPVPTASGVIYVDATSWTDWYYIDLSALADSATRQQAMAQAQMPWPIPLTRSDSVSGLSGIYTYWFDVWGKGLSVNEFRSFTPTAQQAAPQQWSFAVHRNNVRTNGGAVSETALTSMEQLDMTRDELQTLEYTEDEWTETSVWADQSQMLNSLIGSQGIAVNSVLSSWLKVNLPPIPPAFTLNSRVFILRLNDGSFGALQLENYMSPSGTKCWLTIHYKYPL